MNIGKVGIGHMVELKTTHPDHFGRKSSADNISESASFFSTLKSAINKVNDLQNDSDELRQKMIYKPESVDIHSVMIASQKAEIALTLTKSIRDEAIRAFRDLMNLR